MEEKTLYEMILEKLGVEEGEKFNIILENGKPSRFNFFYFEGCHLYDKYGNKSSSALGRLITGKATIEKLHWKPKVGEIVYYVDCVDEEIHGTPFSYNPFDLAMLKCEWYFRTEEKAEANKERVLKEMKEVLNNE